jgi:hypothetical protein
VFDSHYSTNGASALLTASSGSVVRVTARDDFDSDQVVGNGTIDAITKIVIAYNGVASSLIIPTTTPTNYTVNGITYTVTLNADGSVNVAGVQGTSGAGAVGTQIAAYTSNGYSSLEFAHVSGDSFKLGNFGAVIQSTTPVHFTLPVEVIDNDGDVSPPANLDITLTAAAPPIALDLNGDGVHFLPSSAGVTFDYAGNGSLVHTAWVDKNDGLLAIDLDGNGKVNGGAEIVFGNANQSDLQGLAAQYDSNSDGKLDAADASFAKFGVWQDANSNGVSDPGEFKTLAEMGITSISLKGDGVAYSAANGDVMVAGSSTFTKADGSTGIVADISLAIAELQRQAGLPTGATAINSAATALITAMASEQDSAATWGHPAAAHDMALMPIAELMAPDGSLQSLPAIEPVLSVAVATAGSAPTESGHADFTETFHDRVEMIPLAESGHGVNYVAPDSQPSTLFLFGDASHTAMDALLSVGTASAGPGTVTTQALPVVAEALSDAADNHVVDGIVGYFTAATTEPHNAHLGNEFALQGLLNSSVNGSGSDLPHFNIMQTLDHDQLAAVA